MIVYQVNLMVERTIALQYEGWLKAHIQEMLQFTGFKSANLLKKLEAHDAHIYYSVQYFIENQNHLNNYLNQHAEGMRAKALEEFSGRFTATRECFEVIV